MARQAKTASSPDTGAPEFVVVWRHRARAGKREAFVQAYGREGKWVTLFRKSSGYLGTEFLQDPVDPCIFVTIDRWKSARDYRAFRAEHAAEYLALDTICSELTEDEELIVEGVQS